MAYIIKDSLLLVDVSIFLHKSLYVSKYGGDPVSSFNETMKALKRISRSDHVIYCIDDPKPTFRHKALSCYKAHRPEKTEEFKVFKEYVENLIRRKHLFEQQPGFESDDLVASMAVQYPDRVTIGSNDLDLSQLVSDRVSQYKTYSTKYDPNKPYSCGFELVTPDYVTSRFGVYPNQIPSFKALAGDKSDGYSSGIKGLGDVAAAKLLIVYKTLEGIRDALDDEEFIIPKLREPLRENMSNIIWLRDVIATVKTDIVCKSLEKL